MALVTSASLAMLAVSPLQAVEEAEYTVVREDGDFEIREYAPAIVAETVVSGDFEDAGSAAFRKLFKYIDGNNRTGGEIAMTAPVVQEPDQSGWRVAFVLPAEYSWETAPQPTDPRVSLRLVPERTVAAVRFSGTWGEDRFAKRENELRAQLAEHGLQPAGDAVYARYNPPFTPWFMRRNEVMIPVVPAGD